ncbi:MAG: hypothetical protein WD894_23885 [Pirellulales bacterium]
MKHRHLRPFKIEHLETRAMMAGNITAAQVGGDLIIEGDNLDNNLTIENTSANQYELIGGAGNGTRDTTVNGQDTSVVGGIPFTGVTGNIVVRLRGGNDNVEIGFNQRMTVPKALVVDAGDGNDLVLGRAIGGASVGTEMLINLGAGNDAYISLATVIGTSAIVDLGDGDDLGRLALYTIVRDLVVRGGAGGDLVNLTHGLVHAFAVVNGDAGPDSLGGQATYGQYATFQGGDGADVLNFFASQFNGGFLCDQGADFGYTDLRYCQGDSMAFIGQGPQQIGLYGLQARRVEIGLPSSGNVVAIESAVIDEVYAALGNGSDLFVVRSSAINGICSVAAGGGFDVLVNEGNLFGQAHFVGFEVPPPFQARPLRRAV